MSGNQLTGGDVVHDTVAVLLAVLPLADVDVGGRREKVAAFQRPVAVRQVVLQVPLVHVPVGVSADAKKNNANSR